MYELIRLTGSAYADGEIECTVYVSVFGKWVSHGQPDDSSIIGRTSDAAYTSRY
jgi:hypothetical protein